MDTFTARDGTRLAYVREGAGPPLVLIHGTGGSAARWRPVVPALAERYTVYALDRRGRGGSDDGAAYALDSEFDDVAALLAHIGEPVNLLGHSFGGICALEAARRAPNLRRLILYEPPIPVPGAPADVEVEANLARLEALLAAGERAETLLTFMREVVHMPPEELTLYQASPAFPARVAAAHTLPRELRAVRDYAFEASRFGELTTPTLLLLGGDSPARFSAAIELLAGALPNSRVVVLPGQQHIAMDTAPELFVREVVAFLAGGD